MTTDSRLDRMCKRFEVAVESFLLRTRYLLTFLYVVLIVWGLVSIPIDFVRLLMGTISEETMAEHTLLQLHLLDSTMLANLIWLIGVGSFYVFAATYDPDPSVDDRPRSLAHITTGILKEKMAGSIVGVSSVGLLTVFLHQMMSEHPNFAALISIHVVFIAGLLAFNHTNGADHLSHNGHKKEKKGEA